MVQPAAAHGYSSQPLLLVLVGTDIHPFDRLLTWVQRWLADCGSAAPRCVVQRGTSNPPAEPVSSVAFFPHAELQATVQEAAIVVTHGGPATITECRRSGRLPIVVPRDPALREHVDGHQQRFARMFARSGLIRLAESESELRAALDEALAEPNAFEVASPHELLRAGEAPEPVRRVGAVIDALVDARSRSARGWGSRSRRARPTVSQ